MKDFLHKLQLLPEFQKKIIVFGITALIGLALLAWWISSTSRRLQMQQGPGIGEQLQFQELQEQLQNIPVQINGEQ